jgi:hypothetical protein
MQYKAIDVIVLIIEIAAGGQKGWTKENIHAFFEALYINENVVGLIQYLISEVMGKTDSPFVTQVPNSIVRNSCNSSCIEISKYLLINTMFRQLMYQKNNNNITEFDYPFLAGLSVDKQLLNLGDKSPYQKDKIEQFITDYSQGVVSMNLDGTYDLFKSPTDGKEVLPLLDFYRSYIYLDSLAYDANKIFRDGNEAVGCNPLRINYPPNVEKIEWIVDPNDGLDDPKLTIESNRPLLQDFLEPYKEKIKYYYLFYLVTNNDPEKKGKEQINLLNNSYNFIEILNSADTDACSI